MRRLQERAVRAPRHASWLMSVAALLAACAPTPNAALPVSCGATTGGRAGAETQLRFVEANDTEIVLTFGASSASNVFDVPRSSSRRSRAQARLARIAS